MKTSTLISGAISVVAAAVCVSGIIRRLRTAEEKIREFEKRPIKPGLVEVIPCPGPGDIVVLRGFTCKQMDNFGKVWQKQLSNGKPVLVQGKSDGT